MKKWEKGKKEQRLNEQIIHLLQYDALQPWTCIKYCKNMLLMLMLLMIMRGVWTNCLLDIHHVFVRHIERHFILQFVQISIKIHWILCNARHDVAIPIAIAITKRRLRHCEHNSNKSVLHSEITFLFMHRNENILTHNVYCHFDFGPLYCSTSTICSTKLLWSLLLLVNFTTLPTAVHFS